MKEFSEKNTATFKEKEVIFKENEFSKDLYIIKSGKVHLFKRVGNKNIMLGEVDPGGILGEVSVIDGGPRSATAIAVKETSAVKISPVEFKESTKTVPDWFMGIARVLAKRLRETDKKMSHKGPVVNEANITAILIYLFKGAEDGAEGLPLQDVETRIIELLHISISEFNEVLGNLEKKKLLSVKQNRIRTDSASLLESHLEKIRKTLSATPVI